MSRLRLSLYFFIFTSYKTLDDLFEQVEFFVDAVSDYKSDFVLFPEYFNAPLMAKFNDEGESEAIRGLAAYTNEIRELNGGKQQPTDELAGTRLYLRGPQRKL